MLKRRRTSANVEHRYDSENGQVYTESIVTARRKVHPWYNGTVGSPAEVKRSITSGATTLKEIAMCILLRNLDRLELDSFQNVNWTLGHIIWERIRHLGLVSFHTWCIFTNCYGEEHWRRGGSYGGHVSDTHYHLDTVIRDLTNFSQRLDFLTFLTVNDAGIPAQAYLQLSDLPSLAVLKLWETGRSDDPAGFNERILRAWQVASQHQRGFQNLQGLEVTDLGLDSLTLLGHFQHCPQLSLVRILPRLTGKDGDSLTGPWSRITSKQKKHFSHKALLSNKRVTSAFILQAAREVAKLSRAQKPHYRISYGRNEDTRYFRERPMSAEVWVRRLSQVETEVSTAEDATSDPKTSRKLRSNNSTSLKNMLSTFLDV